MNHPKKPKPPTEPKLVERTRVKPIVRRVEKNWNLQALLDELTQREVTDFTKVELTATEADDGYTLLTIWVENITETQTDEQWAVTSAQNEALLQSYHDRLANYLAAEADYPIQMAAYHAYVEAEKKKRELRQLDELKAKYPDHI